MGLNIGQGLASLSARTDVTAAVRQARTGEENAPALARRVPDRERTQAGFGENTLSPGGAALQALDANLREARRVVPTVEELREAFLARRAENERAAETREAPPTEAREPATEEIAPEEQSTRPEPALQARAQYDATTPAPGPSLARLDVTA